MFAVLCWRSPIILELLTARAPVTDIFTNEFIDTNDINDETDTSNIEDEMFQFYSSFSDTTYMAFYETADLSYDLIKFFVKLRDLHSFCCV